MRTHLVRKIQFLFSWLFYPVQIKNELKCKQDELRERLLSQYSLSHLKTCAKKVLQSLERLKMEFLIKVGRAGEPFAVRHIDPELVLLKQFVESLQDVTKPFQVKKEISAVELVALVLDEKRPFQRIRKSAERYAYQAILVDIEFFRNYTKEMLSQVALCEQERVFSKLKNVFQDFEKKAELLRVQKAPNEGFYALFKWRESLDNERQLLCDLLLQSLENQITAHRFKFSCEKGVYYWLGQDVHSLSFAQLKEVFQYLFELVKSFEFLRSDILLLEFFETVKQRFHTMFCSSGIYSEVECIRILQAVRLIEDLVDLDEGMG